MSGAETVSISGNGGQGASGTFLLRRAVEAGLILLAGFLLARLVLTMISPADIPRGEPVNETGNTRHLQQTTDIVALQAADPFRQGAVSADPASLASATEETSLNVRLKGMIANEDGTGVATFLMGNNQERGISVGEIIQPGVRLERLQTNYAIISRGGLMERVTLENRAPAEERAPSVSAKPVGQPGAINTGGLSISSAEDISRILGLRPVRGSDGRVSGYAVFPRDQVAFAALGLKEGDIIRQINGQMAPRDAEGIMELVSGLQDITVLRLVLDRGGETVNVTLDLAGR